MDRLTWYETFARLRADRQRLAAVLSGLSGSSSLHLSLHPSFVCVCFYRIAAHFHRAGHRFIARFFWHLNAIVTAADIPPQADFGPGLVILSPPATALMGVAGRNLTVMPCAGMGGELGRREDIGAGPGLPLLGDDVLLEPHTGILGPIRIGHRVKVPAGVVLTQDVPDDCAVEGPPPRFIRRQDLS